LHQVGNNSKQKAMKKQHTSRLLLVLISFFYLNSVQTSAQVVEVATGLSSPYGLAIDQASHLYISQSGTTNGNKISFIILNDANPVVSDLFTTNLNTPTRLKLSDDNYLYVCESSPTAHRISRANMGSISTPQMLPYFSTGLATPMGIDVKNNTVYVGDFGSYTIKKIITTISPLQASPVLYDLATDVIIDGALLYYANPVDGKVFSNTILNPTMPSSELVTGIPHPSSILLDNGFLYISDSTEGKIYRTSIQGSSTTPTLLVSGLNQPQSMVVFNNELYIAESGANRVVKLNLSNLSNENFENSFAIKVYQNQNILNIQTQKSIKEVSVYDLFGKKVIVDQPSTNSLDISNLAKGVYIIKVIGENDTTLSSKFVKK